MREKLFFIWILCALLCLGMSTILLDIQLPLFGVIYLTVPFIVGLKGKDASKVGFIVIEPKMLIKNTLINFVASAMIIGIFEPWTHIYQSLIELAINASKSDFTFVWLKYYGSFGILITLLFSGLITLFAEELFFRGMLLHAFKKRMSPIAAIILQAVIFALPNLIVSFFMTPLNGVLYVVVYAFLAIGVVGGWSANKTQSIWPSLISATAINFLIVMIYFG